MSTRYAVGIDIGGTKLLAALIRSDGSVGDSLRAQTPADPDEISDVVAGLARKLTVQHGRGSLPVGVGAAGIVGADGVMRFAPNVAWTDYPLRDELERRIDSAVLLDNDANVAAWGEYRAGAGRDARDGMLMLTIGTGLGGGLVADDRLYRGFQGFAGEFGHIIVLEGGPACPCGNTGCLEALASGSAIGRLATEAAAAGQLPPDSALHGQLELTGKSVTLAAQAGDEFAIGILETCGF
ncbi:MAG TPA: ROK family protein, partial [Egibacteraceae bacterium]|nr:ROK family protein [Egibacteraceae bacterium]